MKVKQKSSKDVDDILLRSNSDLVKVADHLWVEEFPGAITVCNSDGIILEMNAKAAEGFKDDGGRELIGTNLLDCHSEAALTKLKQLMEKRQTNVYTIEKNGVRELVFQTPWYKAGEYCGFVELSLVIPDEMPHFVRAP